MKKRILSIAITFALLCGVLPTTAFAAHWADDAVTTLNEIYGSGIFSAVDTKMTEADAYTILDSMGCSSDKVTEGTQTDLTRSKACEVLADVFDLPLNEKSAIEYLFEKNIINGESSGELDETGTVTQAEFAVLTYRVLNSVGGGEGSSVETLKPGTDEYFAWMYLAARKCVPFDVYTTSADTAIKDVKIQTIVKTTDEDGEKWDSADKQGEELWNAWEARLEALAKPSIEITAVYNENETLIQAAKRMVSSIEATQIFSDVSPDSPYYDGVMYLFDIGLVQGTGEGEFLMYDGDTPKPAQRYELAVLLYNYSSDNVSGEKHALIANAVDYVIGKGYMTGNELEAPSNTEGFNMAEWLGDWNDNVTRQDAIYAILDAVSDKETIDLKLDSVNTSILERFTTDNSQISEENKASLAYAVSHGMLNGKNATTLDPNGTLNRGELGVFFYRTLIGVDTTKMQDYRENIDYVLPETPAPDQEQTGQGESETPTTPS